MANTTRTMAGAEIKRIRKKLGWSQQTLADHMNLADGVTVHRWEKGANPLAGPAVILVELFEQAFDAPCGKPRMPAIAEATKKSTPAAEAGAAGVVGRVTA